MRMNYDVSKEQKKAWWLGVSGSVILFLTMLSCYLTIS